MGERDEANLRSARRSLEWAREHLLHLESAARKPNPSEVEQELAHGAYVDREAIEDVLHFMAEGELTAALAVASHSLANAAGRSRYTAAGMVARDQRKRGGAATRKTALDVRLADELRTIRRENSRMSWGAAEQKLATRMAEQPEFLAKLGLQKPLSAEAIRRRRQRDMARARRTRGRQR